MPSKKLLKIPQRACLANRGEWSLLLITALCALLAISPAVGAPLAASSLTVSSFTASSTPVSEAMLWWLGNQLSGQQSTPSALYRALMPSSADPHEVAALLTALEYATSVYPDGSAGDCLITGARSTAPDYAAVNAVPQFSTDYPSLATTARYDATRRLMQYSLTLPEGAARSGLRTNRYLE